MSQIQERRRSPHAALFEFMLIALYLIGMGSAALALNLLRGSENLRAASEFAIASALSLGLLVNAIARR
jgi:hypothetical protein